MMQEGGVILDIVLYVGICFVFGVFDLEIYFWCVVGCYSSTSRKSEERRIPTKYERFGIVPDLVVKRGFGSERRNDSDHGEQT